MATDRLNDLRAFRDFADRKLARGEDDLTLDEALDLWETENRDDDRAATAQAVREALDDMRAGDVGVPASEAIAAGTISHNGPLRLICDKHFNAFGWAAGLQRARA